MRVQIEYRAPVLVTVDTKLGKIISVVVSDEDVRRHESGVLWTEDGQEIPWRSGVTSRAQDIAESAIWPAWEIGL